MAENFGTIVECNSQAGKNDFAKRIRPDAITLYCEDRKELAVLGEWGGDGYPVVWYDVKDGVKYGLALAADGVGNGAFVHQSLKDFLKDVEGESQKLKVFLEALYGEEFFQDAEAVEYAVKSFCSLPPNSFFGTNTNLGQVNRPFYEKDSQYLSSRIVCIAIFYKFRKFFKDRDFTPQNVSLLREQIEEYIDGVSDENGKLVEVGELRKNILSIFDNQKDGGKIMDRIRYFLPCTAAMWFFKSDEKNMNDPVRACAIYSGDARAYKLDLEDGVMQVSIDDADDSGAMTCCIRYCSERNFREETKEHDCSLKATYLEIKKPCSLFACSDGVYDTCLPIEMAGNNKKGLPPIVDPLIKSAQSFSETNDIAFEYNYQQMLRRCYSLDDILNYTAKHIYYHADLDSVESGGIYSHVTSSGNPHTIKRDDSATLAMVFFGQDEHNFPLVIKQLRKTKTSLDRLIDELIEGNEQGKYSYRKSQNDESAESMQIEATKVFTQNASLTAFMKKCATEDSLKVSQTAEQKMWGFGEYPVKNQLMGFSLDTFLKPRKTKIFNQLLNEAEEIGSRGQVVKPYKVKLSEIREIYKKFYDFVLEEAENQAKRKCVEGQLETVEKEEKAYRKIKETICRKLDSAMMFNNKLNLELESVKTLIKEEDDSLRNLIYEINEWEKDQITWLTQKLDYSNDLLKSISQRKSELEDKKRELDRESRASVLQSKLTLDDLFNQIEKAVKKRDEQELIARWEQIKISDKSGLFIASTRITSRLEGVDFSLLGESLPEDITEGLSESSIIPDGWDETNHLLISEERYCEINDIIKAIEPSLDGASGVREYIVKVASEKLKDSPNVKIQQAYDRYTDIAYAKRGEEPLVEKDGYRSVYQTFNRGIKK